MDATDAEPSLSRQDEGARESESLRLGEDPSEAEAGRAAIQRALDWLAKEQSQQPDGSFPAARVGDLLDADVAAVSAGLGVAPETFATLLGLHVCEAALAAAEQPAASVRRIVVLFFSFSAWTISTKIDKMQEKLVIH